MKLNELIIKLQELQNKGLGKSIVYYEGEEECGEVNGYVIEESLKEPYADEIYLKCYIGDMK